MKLEKLQLAGSVAALCVGLFAFASPANAQVLAAAQAAEDRSIRPFTVQVPRPSSTSCGGASTPRAGRIRRLSKTAHRDPSSRNSAR